MPIIIKVISKVIIIVEFISIIMAVIITIVAISIIIMVAIIIVEVISIIIKQIIIIIEADSITKRATTTKLILLLNFIVSTLFMESCLIKDLFVFFWHFQLIFYSRELVNQQEFQSSIFRNLIWELF